MLDFKNPKDLWFILLAIVIGINIGAVRQGTFNEYVILFDVVAIVVLAIARILVWKLVND